MQYQNKSFESDVTSDSDVIFTLIHKAGCERIVFQLLQRCSALALDAEGNSVLHIAATHRLVPLLDMLIFSSWLPQMMQHYNKQGYLPLHLAAWSGFHHFFDLFYPKRNGYSKFYGKNNVAPGEDKTSVMQHSFSGKGGAMRRSKCTGLKSFADETCRLEEVAQKYSININTVTKFDGCTALLGCISRECLSIARTLIACGANVNLADNEGNTCFSLCLEQLANPADSVCKVFETFNFCRVLVETGVRMTSRLKSIYDKEFIACFRLSPLHTVSCLGSTDAVKLLLGNGKDTELSYGPKSKHPVQLALERDHFEVARILLDPKLYSENNFLQEYHDFTGNTLCHAAVSNTHKNKKSAGLFQDSDSDTKCRMKVLQQLHKLCCPLDRPNKMDIRPLDLAISNGDLDIVHHLLFLKPDIVNVQMYQDPEAYPPLHRASTSGSLRLCQVLLSSGAKIGASGYVSRNLQAFHRAFKFDCPDIGVFLCENSSKPLSMTDRKYLLQLLPTLETSLRERLTQRLENVPKLSLVCLDAIRDIFIAKYQSFENIHSLPLPSKIIKALKYEI